MLTSQVVHNPGCVPDDPHLYAGADLIVVFESPYSQYSNKSSSLLNLVSNEINGYSRMNYAYEISGLPTTWSKNDLAGFVDSIKSGASFLFLTDTNIAQQDIYARFGDNWDDFLSVISTYPPKNINNA